MTSLIKAKASVTISRICLYLKILWSVCQSSSDVCSAVTTINLDPCGSVCSWCVLLLPVTVHAEVNPVQTHSALCCAAQAQPLTEDFHFVGAMQSMQVEFLHSAATNER